MTTKARISNPYSGEKSVTLYHTEVPDEVAHFAMSLIEKHANIAATEDGEDTAGRQKLRLQHVEELVTRSFDIAERAFAEARARNLIVAIPDLNEINAEFDARNAEEREAKKERLRAQLEAQKQS